MRRGGQEKSEIYTKEARAEAEKVSNFLLLYPERQICRERAAASPHSRRTKARNRKNRVFVDNTVYNLRCCSLIKKFLEALNSTNRIIGMFSSTLVKLLKYPIIGRLDFW